MDETNIPDYKEISESDRAALLWRDSKNELSGARHLIEYLKSDNNKAVSKLLSYTERHFERRYDDILSSQADLKALNSINPDKIAKFNAMIDEFSQNKGVWASERNLEALTEFLNRVEALYQI